MHAHARERGELGRDAMADEVDVGLRSLAAREVTRQREVRHVHSTVGREIARDEQPRAHLLVARGPPGPAGVAIACTAPARNQNCSPIWVTNGVKLKMSAAVPRLTARMIPRARAHLRVRIGEGQPPLGMKRHDERPDAEEHERNASVDGPAGHLNLGPERRLRAAAEVAADHAPAAETCAERIDVQQVVEREHELAPAGGGVQADRDPARRA